MAIRTRMPTSPARRYLTSVARDDVNKSTPEKSLLTAKRRTNGRNVYGRITVRHRGGGHRGMVGDVDFRREKFGIPARVEGIEYDPNRSAHLALLVYRDGEKRYIVAPYGLKAGDVVMSGPQASILPGNALPIRNIPVGTLVHNVELQPGRGAQLCRSAGAQAQLLAKEGDRATLKLPSGEVRLIGLDCMATIGQRSEERRVGKECRCRWCGSSRRRHTRLVSDWSSDVCSSDLGTFRSARSCTTSSSSRDVVPSSAEAPVLRLSSWPRKATARR